LHLLLEVAAASCATQNFHLRVLLRQAQHYLQMAVRLGSYLLVAAALEAEVPPPGALAEVVEARYELFLLR
jgi:hypothetical protein